MKKSFIFILVLLPYLCYAQGIGSGFAGRGTHVTELHVGGDAEIEGKLVVQESLRVELTSIFKGTMDLSMDATEMFRVGDADEDSTIIKPGGMSTTNSAAAGPLAFWIGDREGTDVTFICSDTTGNVGIGTITLVANSLTLGNKTNQRDLVVTRENDTTPSDSCVVADVYLGDGRIRMFADDGNSLSLYETGAGGFIETDANAIFLRAAGSQDIVWTGAIFYPDSDDAEDFGANTKRWQNGYFSDGLWIGGETSTGDRDYDTTAVVIDISSSDGRLRTFANDGDNLTLYHDGSNAYFVASAGSNILTGGGNNLIWTGSELYTNNRTENIGRTTNPWNISYFDNAVYVSGEATIVGTDSSAVISVTSGAGQVALNDASANSVTKTVASVSTTTGAATALYTFATATDKAYRIFYNVMGIQNDGSNSFASLRIATVKNVSGTVTEINDVSLETQDNDDDGCAINGAVSGTNYIIYVTGINTETWNWTGSFEIVSVAH